jgi:glycosyltransferase EpsE
MPVISVIMGVYNVKSEEMAEMSILSVLNQTFRDFEFIICDDGSDNDTENVIKKIVKDDTRVKFIKNETNKGLAFTLNHCLKYASGEYIARMDIDDYSYPERFEKQLEYMKKNETISFCGTWAELFDDSGVWGVRKRPIHPTKQDLLFGPTVIHPTLMIKRQVLQESGCYKTGWGTTRAEDYELFMRLYAKGFSAGNIPVCLYKFREDEDAYSRRSYKFRIKEAYIRLIGFASLKLYPRAFIYVLKPLIVGLIPQPILRKMRKEDN